MITEFKIRILSETDEHIAEQEIRNAIARAGYDISDFTVEEVEE